MQNAALWVLLARRCRNHEWVFLPKAQNDAITESLRKGRGYNVRRHDGRFKTVRNSFAEVSCETGTRLIYIARTTFVQQQFMPRTALGLGNELRKSSIDCSAKGINIDSDSISSSYLRSPSAYLELIGKR
jgi:hypothetical protein